MNHSTTLKVLSFKDRLRSLKGLDHGRHFEFQEQDLSKLIMKLLLLSSLNDGTKALHNFVKALPLDVVQKVMFDEFYVDNTELINANIYNITRNHINKKKARKSISKTLAHNAASRVAAKKALNQINMPSNVQKLIFNKTKGNKVLNPYTLQKAQRISKPLTRHSRYSVPVQRYVPRANI